MTDLIEKVARELCRDECQELKLNGECPCYDTNKKAWSPSAKAAITTVLREMMLEQLPKAVTQAGGSVLFEHGVSSHLAGEVWVAMHREIAIQHGIQIGGDDE